MTKTVTTKAYRIPQSTLSTYLKNGDVIEKEATKDVEIAERM
jgi:hypothetical protein